MENLHARLLTELAHTYIDDRLRAAAGARAVPTRRRRQGHPRHRFTPTRA